MMWAALGSSRVIGPIFFDGNVGAAFYLQMTENYFYPQFIALKNYSQLIINQKGASRTGLGPFRIGLMKTCLIDGSDEETLMISTMLGLPGPRSQPKGLFRLGVHQK